MANRRNQTIVEDCLKAVFKVGEWDAQACTVTEIAGQMGASTSTTSTLVRRLDDEGLLQHERYGGVTLTPAGLAEALRMVRRHRLIETFLVQTLDYSWDQVHDEAEALEHTISDFMLERMDHVLEHPWRDPHGDGIPTADGVLHLPAARPLAELEVGESGYVVRIHDDSPELLRWFEETGVVLDVPVLVTEQRPFAGSLAVRVGGPDDGATVELGAQPVGALWIGAELPLDGPRPEGCRYAACRHVGATAA